LPRIKARRFTSLVTEIDLIRTATLSAAIRVYIVEFYRTRITL
jgi:hypothetical protein